jgi:aminopeptidase-like protein
MLKLIHQLYMLNRSLVTDDTDRAIEIIGGELPGMTVFEVPSGTECWTWIVPEKWVVNEAYIHDGQRRLVDFNNHPLHLLSYSLPVDKKVSREELFRHLHWSEPYVADMMVRIDERPGAIPYVTKYYERDWGFCVEKSRLGEFKAEEYYVKIDSQFIPGALKVGEYTVTGKSEDVIVIISDICHPAQVNDSITGVVVAVDVARELSRRQNFYTYKFLFLPETIGSVVWLSRHEELIPKIRCALFSEMLGNDNSLILQHSFHDKSLIDRVARSVMSRRCREFREGAFREVLGNDEIVFNGPGVNIPTISISRWPYPEYHTSDDNPDIVKAEKLEEAKAVILEILEIVDRDFVPKRKFKGPVFLSRYGLWVDWHEGEDAKRLNRKLEQVIMYLDGEMTAFDIAEKVGLSFEVVEAYLRRLHGNDLIDILRVSRGTETI